MIQERLPFKEKLVVLKLGTAILECEKCGSPLSERNGQPYCRNVSCLSFGLMPVNGSFFGSVFFENGKSLKGIRKSV